MSRRVVLATQNEHKVHELRQILADVCRDLDLEIVSAAAFPEVPDIAETEVTFAGAVEIPARVVYVHPLHNLVVLQYDPALLRGTEVRSATLDAAPLREGEQVADVFRLEVGEVEEFLHAGIFASASLN